MCCKTSLLKKKSSEGLIASKNGSRRTTTNIYAYKEYLFKMKIIHFLYNKLNNMVYQNSLPSAAAPFRSPSPNSSGLFRTLNILGLWICSPRGNSETWIDQGSEYASGSEYTRVLNMLGLRKVLVCLNMPK